MDKIYSYSRHTIVWLGENLTAVDWATFDTLRTWRANSTSSDPRNSFQDKATAANRLLERHWFTRRWVVQEYAPSRRCTFLLSSMEIGVAELMAFIASFSRRERGQLRVSIHDPREALDPAFDGAYQHSLLWNLHAFDGTKFSNPQDSVYALHAISFDRHRIQVNYSKPVRAIFLDLARLYVQHDETHWPLLASAVSRPRNKSFPSWLAD